MLKIAGLWLTNKTIQGPISPELLPGRRLVVMPNTQKRGNQPDYYAFLAIAGDDDKPPEDKSPEANDPPPF